MNRDIRKKKKNIVDNYFVGLIEENNKWCYTWTQIKIH